MSDTTISITDIENLTRHLKLIANSKRLQILNLLMEGVQCNCELGDALNMPINLISHHMGLLRKAGLVDVERDEVDARWVYFSINEQAMQDFNLAYSKFFDLSRIQPRHPKCGPQTTVVEMESISITHL
ncbi:MAG: winged helix-turn-helix transcriptional regulator [Chloroflexi bacterium]|nr:winged helix-turn-helix transcriptional regulator [Chloroflexota bacterium]